MPNSLKCKIKHLCHNRTITESERDRILKALEQEPCEDYISRQAVIDDLEKSHMTSGVHNQGTWNECVDSMIHTVRAMPSVNPQKSDWIPVGERLPEDGGNYLVTIVFDIGGKEPVREVRKDYFCNLSKKWLYEEKNVVAWMPLPEPYKEESEE